MKICFEIFGIPRGQGRARSAAIFGRKKDTGEKQVVGIRTFTAPIDENWRDLVLRQVQQHRPAAPMTGPVRLELVFLMPMPLGMRKRDRRRVEQGDVLYHWKRPDMDQLEKPLMDMLQHAGYYADDGQVADRGGTRKIYAVQPGVRVTVEALT